jgi:dTDP-4-amino-4,6-dideoxygalactose transaminase
MKIEFVDLKRQLFGDSFLQTKGIHKEISKSLDKCVENANFIMGSPLEKFEEEFAKYCGVKYCMGLNSGTDALEFALLANDIKDGNVITIPSSYFTTASSIIQVGATPKFVDIDKDSYNLDSKKLNDKIDENTRAIIPVHLYGRPSEMDKIMEIADRRGIKVIEDCCQAHGARLYGKRVPISGTGAFSFYPGKNLGCWGDGGAVVTNDEEVAEKVKMLRNDGTTEKYNHQIIGRKSRLDAIQAAILSVKLKYLDSWNESRKKSAILYNSFLKELDDIKLPLLEDNIVEPVFHVYPILTSKREELAKHLNEKGISTNIHYPTPIHLQKAYETLGLDGESFPIAEEVAEKTLSLPIFPELRNDEIKYICEKIRDFFS